MGSDFGGKAYPGKANWSQDGAITKPGSECCKGTQPINAPDPTKDSPVQK